MSSYLVINLADRNGFGPISSLHSGVTAKRTNRGLSKLFKGIDTTNLVNAFDLLDKDLLSQLNRNDPELTDLRSKCDAAKKIYLATHGLPTDVDHAFANAAGGNPLCTAEQLAKFLLLILPKRDRTYQLTLVMCYGARTATYRHAHLDHQGPIPFSDLQSSFYARCISCLQ